MEAPWPFLDLEAMCCRKGSYVPNEGTQWVPPGDGGLSEVTGDAAEVAFHVGAIGFCNITLSDGGKMVGWVRVEFPD